MLEAAVLVAPVASVVLIGVGMTLYRNMKPKSVGQWSWYIWCIFVAAVALFMVVVFMSMPGF